MLFHISPEISPCRVPNAGRSAALFFPGDEKQAGEFEHDGSVVQAREQRFDSGKNLQLKFRMFFLKADVQDILLRVVRAAEAWTSGLCQTSCKLPKIRYLSVKCDFTKQSQDIQPAYSFRADDWGRDGNAVRCIRILNLHCLGFREEPDGRSLERSIRIGGDSPAVAHKQR